jgi:two-component system, NtrC family, sensor kinase
VTRNEYKYVADIELDLAQLPLVTVALGDINQVLLNLIVNAAQAIHSCVQDSGKRGRITIRTRSEPESVVITVNDTGGGISPAIARRVFDPFFTTKPVGQGTGHGLAIAHKIIAERHHGTIDFESTPGVGTTFRIRLPREHPDPAGLVPPAGQ